MAAIIRRREAAAWRLGRTEQSSGLSDSERSDSTMSKDGPSPLPPTEPVTLHRSVQFDKASEPRAGPTRIFVFVPTIDPPAAGSPLSSRLIGTWSFRLWRLSAPRFG